MTPREEDDGRPVDRRSLVADLTACQNDLHHLLATATPDGLRAQTTSTRWSNAQLLFHMVFGFLIVRRLLPLVRLMSVLRPGVGRAFAGLLDAGRVPFHWVNYAGSCAGALVFNHDRMGWLCDRTIDHLVRSLEQEPLMRLSRGMPFPTTWDPYFTEFMTSADVYAYPVRHYAHHRAQLTLNA